MDRANYEYQRKSNVQRMSMSGLLMWIYVHVDVCVCVYVCSYSLKHFHHVLHRTFGADVTPQERRCQATWRQTSNRQSTAVSSVRPLATTSLSVPFYPPLHHNLLWHRRVNNSIYFTVPTLLFFFYHQSSKYTCTYPSINIGIF